MSTIQLTKEELFEAMDDYEDVSYEPYRWGTTDTYIFKRLDKYYEVTVQMHPTEGIQEPGPFEAVEVKPVPVTTTEWVTV